MIIQHIAAASACLDAGTPDKALSHVEKALAEDPDSYVALLVHARTLNAIGRYKDAAKVAEKAISLDPDAKAAYTHLAWSYINQRAFVEAKDTLDRLREIDPTYPAYLTLSAELGFRLNDIEQVRDATDQMLLHLPDAVETHTHRAAFLLRMQEPLEAERHARRALEINAEAANAHFLLGRALMRQKRAEEAVPALESAQRLRPGDKTAGKALKQAVGVVKTDRRFGKLANALTRFGIGPLFAGLLVIHTALQIALIYQRLGYLELDDTYIVLPLIMAWALGLGSIDHQLRCSRAFEADLSLSDDY